MKPITIGVCCTAMHKEPVRPIIDELARLVMESESCRMIVYQSFGDLYYNNNGDYGSRSVFDLINADMLDVMILFPDKIFDKGVVRSIIDRCTASGVPVLCVDEEIEGTYGMPLAHGKAFSEIVEHVLSVHGCRRVKLVAGVKDNPFSETRVESCREVMARYGLTLDEGDILYGEFWETPTYEAMDRFFESGEPVPEAFICCNDSMAMAVCVKLNQHGLKVPDDVIVTGFDGIEMEKYHTPRLTTAFYDPAAVAARAMELIREVTSEQAPPPYSSPVYYTPVISESCGCKEHSLMDSNHSLVKYVNNNSSYRYYEEHLDNMENEVAVDPSIENVHDVLSRYSFGASVLCMTERMMRYFGSDEVHDDAAEQTTYPQNMIVFSSTFDDGRFTEGTLFSSEELLPNLDGVFVSEYKTIYVLPVFFQRNVIGYYVTPYVAQELHNERLYSFSLTLNRCLETMRLHEHLSILNRRLSFLFNHDQLTGIYNRYGFYENFAAQMKSVAEGGDVFVVSADLNGMKEINDMYGHNAGDDALIVTARSLTEAAGSDSEIICSRFGGDEFVVARVCGGDARERGELFCGSFYKALARFNEEGRPYRVDVGVGLYSAPLTEVSSIDALLELADKLMYSDKARYKRKPRNPIPPRGDGV